MLYIDRSFAIHIPYAVDDLEMKKSDLADTEHAFVSFSSSCTCLESRRARALNVLYLKGRMLSRPRRALPKENEKEN